MTDRVRTLVVQLEDRYRTDDVAAIADAIRLLRGVREVSLGPVDSVASIETVEAAKWELRKQLLEILHPSHRAPSNHW